MAAERLVVTDAGGQNQDAAYKFLNFLMDPKQQAIFASQIPYGPTNSKTIGYLSEQRARILPTYPANLKLMVGIDDQWVADHLDEIPNSWSQWQAK